MFTMRSDIAWPTRQSVISRGAKLHSKFLLTSALTWPRKGGTYGGGKEQLYLSLLVIK